MPASKEEIAKLLKAAHVNPNSFEAELGLLVHKWLLIVGIDKVLDGLDAEVDALEGRRDLQVSKGQTPFQNRSREH